VLCGRLRFHPFFPASTGRRIMVWLRLTLLVGVILLGTCSIAGAQEFVIDKESPQYPGARSSADVTGSPGGWKVYTATTLGLAAAHQMDAFSYGHDPLRSGSLQPLVLFYSVSRASSGEIGSVIRFESTGNGAAGDKFAIAVTDKGESIGRARLVSDAVKHGLSPLPNQSNIAGLGIDYPYKGGLYLSVDPEAAAILGVDPADILYQADVRSPAALTPYAKLYELGLQAGDDIDALAIWAPGGSGVLAPDDIVYVSLAPGSPSLASFGTTAGGIIQVHPTPRAEVFSPKSLELLETDDLDGMATYQAANEWSDIPYVQGRFSRIYFDYVPGTPGNFHVINDWVSNQDDGGTNGGLNATEYNLFTFTIGSTDYEIRIWQDGSAEVVPDDLPGFEYAFGWATSPNEPLVKHTIWEWTINAEPGAVTQFRGKDPVNRTDVWSPSAPGDFTGGPSAYAHIIDGEFSDVPAEPDPPPDPAREYKSPDKDDGYGTYTLKLNVGGGFRAKDDSVPAATPWSLIVTAALTVAAAIVLILRRRRTERELA
jgi:hypothetical protein